MTREQAQRLVASLEAAFPFPRIPEATFALYVSELGELQDVEVASVVVKGFVRTIDRFPTIAAIREAYAVERHRLAGPRAEARGLPEPEAAAPPPEVREWLKQFTLKDVA